MERKEAKDRQPKTTSLWSVIALLSLIASTVTLGLWTYHELRISALRTQYNERMEVLEEKLSVYQNSEVSGCFYGTSSQLLVFLILRESVNIV